MTGGVKYAEHNYLMQICRAMTYFIFAVTYVVNKHLFRYFKYVKA